MAVVVRVARSLRPDLVNPRRGPSLHVLSRQPLSPRQGVAVTRFRDRILLLSYGEGGVRLITSVPETPRLEEAGSEEEEEVLSGRTGWPAGALEEAPALSFPKVWSRVRKAAGLGGAVMLMLFAAGLGNGLAAGEELGDEGMASGLSSAPALPQESPADGAQVSPEGTLVDLARQLPSMGFQIGDEDGLSVSGPVGTVLFIGFLTLLPTVLLMMTGFTRILVVLHLLKQAMGTQTAPPAHLLAAMALLLTGFVMAPTLSELNRTAVTPWMTGEMDELTMMQTASGSFRTFMLGATEEADLVTFMEMHGGDQPQTLDEIPMVVVTSAFVTSELRHAFQIGFALFLPFVVIDIVVASVLMSMGMFMLPPVMVSLPFKLLLFVLVDGWSLVVGGLVQSFA
jgi:flagellar biosynthetic protein FliP